MKKLNIAVVFGGVSSEYEISLMSVASVLRNIPREKYDVVMLGITKGGSWFKYDGDIKDIEEDKWQQGNIKKAFISPDSSIHGVTVLHEDGYENIYIDVVFPVLHGKNGEDGTIQGVFEMAGIPFVGCDHISSANCMDKAYTHMILDHAGIKTSPYIVARNYEDYNQIKKNIKASFGYPCYVKPANAGSSVGVSKAKDENQLVIALDSAFIHDKKLVIEKAIVGKEVECAVLGNDEPMCSVPGEIVPISEFYDYQAKYVSGTTELHIPARLSDEETKRVQEIAIKAYKALSCSGFTRVDFFVCDDGEVILNEPNTIPGFTSISMYPKLWEKTGIPYGELIDRLIMLAQDRK